MSELPEPEKVSLAQRWREGTIGAPSLAALFVVLVVVVGAGASLGGGGGIAIILAALISMIALLALWSTSARDSRPPPGPGQIEPGEAETA